MAEDNQQQQVTFNEDALKSTIRTAVTDTIGEMRQQEQLRQQQAQAQMQSQQRQAAFNQQYQQDPVAQTLAPYLQPIVQQLTVQAQAANDKADFYSLHPEASAHRAEVEQMFNTLMAQGRPTDRESLYYFMKGKDPEKFAKSAADQLAQAQASGASVGAAAVPRPEATGFNAEAFGSLPVEKMREALKDVSF